MNSRPEGERGLKNFMLLSQKTFVFNEEGKFLTLLRTASAPTRPLKWDLPGGIYEIGESPIEGARREIREESGLEVDEMRPLCLVGEYNDEGKWCVTVAYQAKAITTDVALSFEHQEYKWVTKEEFLGLESSAKWQQIAKENL